jgi:predicted kinase
VGAFQVATRFFRGAALGRGTAGRRLTGPLTTDPVLVVLMGVPGSGKSTVAAKWRPSQVLSLDDFRKIVSGDENNQAATGEAVRALHTVLDGRLRRRLTTVVDATNVEAAARRPLLGLAAAHEMPAVALVVDTPLHLAQARNATRPGPIGSARWGRRVPAEFVDRQYDQLRASIPGLRAEGFAQVIIHRG